MPYPGRRSDRPGRHLAELAGEGPGHSSDREPGEEQHRCQRPSAQPDPPMPSGRADALNSLPAPASSSILALTPVQVALGCQARPSCGLRPMLVDITKPSADSAEYGCRRSLVPAAHLPTVAAVGGQMRARIWVRRCGGGRRSLRPACAPRADDCRSSAIARVVSTSAASTSSSLVTITSVRGITVVAAASNTWE